MSETPESGDRRRFLRTAGTAIASVLGGALTAGSSQARADERRIEDESVPDLETSRESAANSEHWAQIEIGTSVHYNRVNNWSPVVDEAGETAGPIGVPGRWSRASLVRDADVNVLEPVYGEAMDLPRKFMTTQVLSRGGAGTITADAWAGLEFYTTGTAAQTATVRMSAMYDIGMNEINIREFPGLGYAGNFLDMVVSDLSAGELARATIWQHSGVAENYSSYNVHQQTSEEVWPYNDLSVTLEPNRYYGVYFTQRSIVNSPSPITDVTGGIYPSEAFASQHVGIGHIYITF